MESFEKVSLHSVNHNDDDHPDKVLKHMSTLTVTDIVPVIYLSLLIVWILFSNRQERLRKQTKWTSNKKVIGIYRVFCGFVDSKPEGRKTAIGIISIDKWKWKWNIFPILVSHFNFSNCCSTSERGDKPDQLRDQHHHIDSLYCQNTVWASP